MMFPLRTTPPRRALLRPAPVVLILTAALLTATTPSAHAQSQYFDTDGDIIGAVAGDAIVGSGIVTAITVTGNAGTSVDGNIQTYNNSTLNLTGGTSVGPLYSFNNSILNLSGGAFSGFLDAFDNSVVNLSGGTIDGPFSAFNNSSLNISGGTFGGYLDASDFTVVNYSGGTFGGYLLAQKDATLNVFGSGLVAALVDPNVGTLSQYSLSGTLSDGTALVNQTLYVQHDGATTFRLINAGVAAPEPSALYLLAAGGVFGLILRKRRSQRAGIGQQ